MATKLLIAEDHSVTLKGLALLAEYILKKRASFFAVGSCHQLMRQLVTKTYTHLILDILLSDGSALETIPTIRNLYPGLEIMIFSAQPSVVFERALVRYRIHYILSKDMPETETIRLMRQFLTNERPAMPPALKDRPEPFAGMPPREIDVLRYLLKGWKTGQIAHTLNLSISTISTLKSRIFERTQTTNIRELMDLASLHHVS